MDDWGRRLAFYSKSAERQASLRTYQQSRSTADFFAFISGMTGVAPHQIEDEIVRFLNFAGSHSPVNVCEIGTADGGTNFLLSQAIPSVRFMLGIDLFVKNTHCLKFFSRPGQELHYLNASSYAPATIDKVRGLLAGRKLDLLFIDGDHTYDGVKKDFVFYKEFVREGGIIAFHDIVPDYKTRFGRETGRWAGEVPAFWSKIKPLYPSHEFIQDREQDGLGIGCIEYQAAVQLPAGL